MLKEILTWTIILLIAWFIFNGGVYKVYDFVLENVEQNKIEIINYEKINLEIPCSLLRNSVRELGVDMDWMANQQCDFRCKSLNKSYVKYSCNEGIFNCLCN